ncbi:MAG: C40 family peptidase [Epsilonproteobacteria bacterium]|nr:C40 family peptidase [Campylobacterota bacterium]
MLRSRIVYFLCIAIFACACSFSLDACETKLCSEEVLHQAVVTSPVVILYTCQADKLLVRQDFSVPDNLKSRVIDHYLSLPIEKQLVFGMCVNVVEWQKDWARVRVSELPVYRGEHGWVSNEGWVPVSCLRPIVGSRESHVKYKKVVITKPWTTVKAWERNCSTPQVFSIPMGAQLLEVNMSLESGGAVRNCILHHQAFNGWYTIEVRYDDAYAFEERVEEGVEQLREKIVETARSFDGPYIWGGRSPYDAQYGQEVTGVDCSGLIDLVYRCVGLMVGCDAHDQFVLSDEIEGSQLLPGDLIFFSRADKRPDRVNHVMLYLGQQKAIEATGEDPHCVRIDELPAELFACKNGANWKGRHVFFGSFLTQDKIYAMRSCAYNRNYNALTQIAQRIVSLG